ncbi:CubicO group peptidase (beta-lactamase class C family) [Myroides indicus]|uniref:CubicO group peptidase (Beta-lactamase class C family) n=2 Tax=Myroides indicus TaxID=1323422 RepID=A0A4R7F2M5_9FLAO|nr:CubicO group peptidase (beta-lactamase class C family) [Myroides indicus]
MLTIVLLCCVNLFAQQKQYDNLIAVFIEDYNTSDYDDFYRLFSEALQKELPAVKAYNFFAEMKEKLGNIKSMEFYGLDENNLALYKTEFESEDIMLLNLAVNTEGELVGFRVINFPQDQADLSFLEQSEEEIIYELAINLPDKGQLAIAVINGDEVKYIGIKKDRTKLKSFENKKMLFGLGNFNTIFTATLLSEAITDKKINLSDLVNSYFDFPFKDSLQFSFASLANNSSFLPVLPEYFDADHEINNRQIDDLFYYNFSVSDLERYFKNEATIDSLEMFKRQRFSFIGFALLGESLSRIYKKPYEELIQDKIFDKYELNSTTIQKPQNKKVVKGYDANGKEIAIHEFNLFKTATGGYSNLIDLSKFVQAQFSSENQVLKLTQQPTLIITPGFWSALGWKIIHPEDPGRSVYFSKAIDVGYSNYIGFSLQQKKGIVVLSNSSTPKLLDALDELTYKLMAKQLLM